MRLIDADELIDNLDCSDRGIWARFEIEDAPTIDAVPVVRCRECMHWQSGEKECEKWEYCTFHNIGIGPHSFCSYGERKDGEG